MFQNKTQIVKKQVILLINSNKEKWHYLAIKKILGLLREITSKHHGDFYCVEQKKNLNYIQKSVKIKIFPMS